VVRSTEKGGCQVPEASLKKGGIGPWQTSQELAHGSAKLSDQEITPAAVYRFFCHWAE